MATFQIYLMSLRDNENEFSPKYSLIPISDFQTQHNELDTTAKIPIQMSELLTKEYNGENISNYRDKRQYLTAFFEQDKTFCYTYDEKFQIHQNTQCTLTFSMNRNIIRADRIEKNPFINYLFIGAQLLLIDKYNNHHLMTISKISYEFKSYNTVFKYECQDSFNYQLSRQNTGYEIENNSDNIDFIGAQSLDWWVLCKIHPECKISYQYLKLEHSDFSIKKFAYNLNSYPDLYRTVPFSASGTANSVLIALGDLYDLQLRVYERVDLDVTTQDDKPNNNYGRVKKFYWFEPKKSLRPTGLKYSPYLDLQSFSLEHNSVSFSSILNIQNNTLGEEIISVLPPVPTFFKQWFETEEWQASSFIPGLFSEACQEKIDSIQYDSQQIDDIGSENNELQIAYENNKLLYDSKEGYVYIPIKPSFWSNNYQYLKFTTNGGVHSVFTVGGINTIDPNNSSDSMVYNSKFVNWEVVYKLTDKKSNSIEFQENILYSSQTELPVNLIKEYGLDYCFLKLYFAPSYKSLIISGKIYISQYRIPTAEELEFAQIADQIPWLENKLINFNYFYEHSIINLNEYQELMQLLENDLRKANAKLLLYSQLYYQAIQNKTKIIANLSAKIDKVGAVFQADLINPFMIDGRTNTIADFNLAMSDLFENSSEPIRLITYYETLTDYVNKYFNAEQTFLKNMYLFREYFESKSNFGTLYSYNFTLSSSDINDNTTITFTTPEKYVKLTDENKFNPIYEKQDEIYVLYDKNEILDKSNYKNNNFYYLDPDSDNMIRIGEKNIQYHGYNDNQTYYELQWETKDSNFIEYVFKQEGEEHSVFKYIKLFTTKWFEFSCTLIEPNTARIACRDHCLHTIETPEAFKYNGDNSINNIIPVFIKVDYTALRTNFFYHELNNPTNKTLWYMHRRNTDWEQRLQSVSNWKNFNDLGLKGSLLNALSQTKNLTAEDLDNLTASEPELNTAEKVYKQCFPISSYYWKGVAINEDGTNAKKIDYHLVPFVNIENASQFYRRVSVSLDAYKNWQIGLAIGGAASVLGLVPFTLPGTLISAAVAPAIWGICQACWNNGKKSFNNTGWSFHDVFNCDITSFQGWNPSNRLLYTKTAEGYRKTNGKNVFASDVIQGETWVDQEEPVKIISNKWGYHEAMNLLLTYYSLSDRLTQESKEKYFYETSYYRILKSNDYVDKKDSFIMLWYSNNDIDVDNLITIDDDSDELLIGSNAIKTIKRLDTTIYYPLKNHISHISGVSFKWPKDKNRMKLAELLEFNQMIKYTIKNQYVFIDSNQDGTADSGARVIYLKEETWGYEDLSVKTWENTGYNKIVQLAASNFYDNNTFEQINLITKFPKMTVGFYITGTDEEDYLPTTQLKSLDENKMYYKKINNRYERRYTMQQLINKQNMYVKLSDTYHYDSFSDLKEFTVQYFLYDKKIEEDGRTVFNFKQSNVGVLKQEDDNTWYLFGENIKQKCLFELHTNNDLNTHTKGAFWYKYKNHNNTLLMEKAMLIETNLTEYWTNAYYASKNCKYFLPEYWQPVVNQQKNYFSSDIVSMQTSTSTFEEVETHIHTDINIRSASSDDYYQVTHTQIEDVNKATNTHVFSCKQPYENMQITSVRIFIGEDPDPRVSALSPLEYTISLDGTYTFKYIDHLSFLNTITFKVQKTLQTESPETYITEFIVEEDYSTNNDPWEGDLLVNFYVKSFTQQTQTSTSLELSTTYVPEVKKLPNEWYYQLRHQAIDNTIEDIYTEVSGLRINESIGLNTLANTNIVIQDMIKYLNIDIVDWKAIKLKENYVLYEHLSGGTLWSQMLDKLSGGVLINNQFGGWYDMMIKVLKTCHYENYNPVQYHNAQREHDSIWKRIYTQYPHLCYEQSYTNEDATSSRELLQLAQWAFRDCISPESNYNITVIDLNTLKGYQGQELNIGDAIEIDAEKLYDDVSSDIYKSLIQYLYITDINYDLRKDDGIQLTINTIKYSNRVLKDLVKLIR